VIYVQQFKERPGTCSEPFRFTQAERDGVNVDRVGARCFPSCSELRTSPFPPLPCTDALCNEVSIPLPPGGETGEYIDRVWTTLELPPECLFGPIDNPESVGPSECKIEGPVPDGVYTLRAVAFTEVQPQPTTCLRPDEEAPPACFLGIPGTEIRAEATTTVSGERTEVTLVFRDTPGGPDAGASGAP